MSTILEQLKKRRKSLGLKQTDMKLRAGISRQQYQYLESKGNPRLDTLELVATALNSKLLLIPQEKQAAVQAILDSDNQTTKDDEQHSTTEDNPWKDILEDDE